MKDRKQFCATCGTKRTPIQQRRESWGWTRIIVVDEHKAVSGAWEQSPQLIASAAVYRNGGTSDDCHLCDECLLIGLRALKETIDAALGVAQ